MNRVWMESTANPLSNYGGRGGPGDRPGDRIGFGLAATAVVSTTPTREVKRSRAFGTFQTSVVLDELRAMRANAAQTEITASGASADEIGWPEWLMENRPPAPWSGFDSSFAANNTVVGKNTSCRYVDITED